MCYKNTANPESISAFTASTNLTGRQDIARIDLAAFHSTLRYILKTPN